MSSSKQSIVIESSCILSIHNYVTDQVLERSTGSCQCIDIAKRLDLHYPVMCISIEHLFGLMMVCEMISVKIDAYAIHTSVMVRVYYYVPPHNNVRHVIVLSYNIIDSSVHKTRCRPLQSILCQSSDDGPKISQARVRTSHRYDRG